MHLLNRLIAWSGFAVCRNGPHLPGDVQKRLKEQFRRARESTRGFHVYREFLHQGGGHPILYKDFECAFAAQQLNRCRPVGILDVGSYTDFVLGLLAFCPVTVVDVRPRDRLVPTETVLCADARRLDLADQSFDAVTSLSSIEHVGLGRYGDPFDLEGDGKAFGEMVRVLKPGGLLVFSTTLTRGQPALVFNAHRIYGLEMIRGMCAGLEHVEESYFSQGLGRVCSYEEVTQEPQAWDVYCGCYRKSQAVWEPL